ncbi:hypothetical protein JB92DRAFT_3100340 [Gautieria morchelliformis]|nr:hypothetical protein JB92DRAFT_3100340 [Gautieria morchelliformis]
MESVILAVYWVEYVHVRCALWLLFSVRRIDFTFATRVGPRKRGVLLCRCDVPPVTRASLESTSTSTSTRASSVSVRSAIYFFRAAAVVATPLTLSGRRYEPTLVLTIDSFGPVMPVVWFVRARCRRGNVNVNGLAGQCEAVHARLQEAGWQRPATSCCETGTVAVEYDGGTRIGVTRARESALTECPHRVYSAPPAINTPWDSQGNKPWVEACAVFIDRLLGRRCYIGVHSGAAAPSAHTGMPVFTVTGDRSAGSDSGEGL